MEPLIDPKVPESDAHDAPLDLSLAFAPGPKTDLSMPHDQPAAAR